MVQKRIRFEFGMIKFRSSLQQQRDPGVSLDSVWFLEPSLSSLLNHYPSDENSVKKDDALESNTEQETIVHNNHCPANGNGKSQELLDKNSISCVGTQIGINEARRVSPRYAVAKMVEGEQPEKLSKAPGSHLRDPALLGKRTMMPRLPRPRRLFETKSKLCNDEDDASESSDCCEEISLDEADALWGFLADPNRPIAAKKSP